MKKVYLTDDQGNELYPKTITDQIVLGGGDIKDKFDEISLEINNMQELNTVKTVQPNFTKQRVSSAGVIQDSNYYLFTDVINPNKEAVTVKKISDAPVHGFMSVWAKKNGVLVFQNAGIGTQRDDTFTMRAGYYYRFAIFYNTTSTRLTDEYEQAIKSAWEYEITDTKFVDSLNEIIDSKVDVIKNSVKNIDTDIQNLKNNGYTIPDYWQETIDNKCSEIINKITEITSHGHQLSAFMTTTDPHRPSHSEVSQDLIHYVQEKCGIRLHICLGDFIEDAPTHKENIERIESTVNALKKASDIYLLTQGNHDNGVGIKYNGMLAKERIVYDEEWIMRVSSTLQKQPNLVFDDNRKAYYYDDYVNKIRFINIDSFGEQKYTIEGDNVTVSLGKVSQRQADWINNIALSNIPNDFAVVTFSHTALFAPYISKDGEYLNLDKGQIGGSSLIYPKIQEFKNNGGIYIGHWCGHLHYDFVTQKYGFTCVQQLNDGFTHRTVDYWGSGFEFLGDAPLKTKGTTTECAVDVVIIDRTDKKVNLIRIGAGENREFTY